MLPFTMEELKQAVKDKYVTARNHPTLPYTIYNYAPEIQWLNKWNDITINCRGLILDEFGAVIARPWRKFFNLGQVDPPIQFDTPVEVMDKVDGSLGVLYPGIGDDSWAIATRGSFESDQAIHGTEVWLDKYSDRIPNDFMTRDMMHRFTFLFEIVYPSNRIVLDYSKMDDLVLLGAVEKAAGHYVGPQTAAAMIAWPGPVVKVFQHRNLSEALGDLGRPNAEGFVVRSHNFMVKLKQPDYVELHRLVTNVSPKSVWEQLRGGKSKDEIVSNFPDEFHGYVSSMIDPLLSQYNNRVDEILDGYSNATGAVMKEVGDRMPNRKEYAQAFKRSRDARYYFLLLDGNPISDVVWKELRPKDEDAKTNNS